MGTKAFVESLGYAVADLCSNGISAYNSILTRLPAVAVLDMNMPGMTGMEVLDKLQKAGVPTRVVLLTMHNEVSIFNRAVELGARGYLLKEAAEQELAPCLDAVFRGETWFSAALSGALVQDRRPEGISPELEKLTLSERKIIALIAAQHTSREIAQMLFITEKTVENHRSAIIRKLNIPPEKNALLIWAVQHHAGTGTPAAD